MAAVGRGLTERGMGVAGPAGPHLAEMAPPPPAWTLIVPAKGQVQVGCEPRPVGLWDRLRLSGRGCSGGLAGGAAAGGGGDSLQVCRSRSRPSAPACVGFPAPVTGEQESLVPESRRLWQETSQLGGRGRGSSCWGPHTEGKGAAVLTALWPLGPPQPPPPLGVHEGSPGGNPWKVLVTQVTLVKSGFSVS